MRVIQMWLAAVFVCCPVLMADEFGSIKEAPEPANEDTVTVVQSVSTEVSDTVSSIEDTECDTLETIEDTEPAAGPAPEPAPPKARSNPFAVPDEEVTYEAQEGDEGSIRYEQKRPGFPRKAKPTTGYSKRLMQSRRLQDQQYLREARENAARGAAVYFVGLALGECVAGPMMVAGAVTGEEGLFIAGDLVGVLSQGFLIAGPIRCGVGGSMAYDRSRQMGLVGMPAPKHWGFYRAGWALTAISTVLGVVGTFAGDSDASLALSMVTLGLGVTADAMWITSCASSLRYTRQVNHKAKLAGVHVQPTLIATGNGNTGLGLSCSFGSVR